MKQSFSFTKGNMCMCCCGMFMQMNIAKFPMLSKT